MLKFYFQEKLSKPNMLVILVTGPLGSGIYRCEVTTETPKFITLSANATVTVMTPPVNPPIIVGVESYYNPGKLFKSFFYILSAVCLLFLLKISFFFKR